MLSFWAVYTHPYGCVDGSRQRNTKTQCSHLFNSLGLKNAAALSLPLVPRVQETRPKGFFFAIPNSHLRAQLDTIKKLELSMHNTEAREEALAGNTASLDPPPIPGQEGSPATLDFIIWVWAIINSRKPLAPLQCVESFLSSRFIICCWFQACVFLFF